MISARLGCSRNNGTPLRSCSSVALRLRRLETFALHRAISSSRLLDRKACIEGEFQTGWSLEYSRPADVSLAHR